MRKLIALVLVAVMMVAMAISASAASIDVTNVIDGETYTAYKILNYRDNGETGDDRAVSYYLTSDEYTDIGAVLEAAGFAFTASSDGTEYFVNNADSFDAAAAAEYLGGKLSDLGSALGTYTATGANGEASFENLATGYYFVTTTAGSLCALHEDTDIATVVEKNTVPSIDKTQSNAVDGTYTDDALDFNIGDTVYYKIVITDGTGTNAIITMTDTMSDGLDYTAGSLKINGEAVADDADTDDWTVTVSGRVITIVFSADYVAGLDAEDKIIITYDATINEDAVVDSEEDNENKAELDYSEQNSNDKVYVATYDFQLYKTDGTSFLDGAGFKLYDDATGGNQIKLGKDDTGYFVDASSDEEIMVDSADGVNVRGLAPGVYYLEETTVPDGYNKLAERVEVTINTGANAPVEITVANQAGTVLPSTGSIGTTIFYVVGAILVLGAGVLLVIRRKMNSN